MGGERSWKGEEGQEQLWLVHQPISLILPLLPLEVDVNTLAQAISCQKILIIIVALRQIAIVHDGGG